MIEIEDITAFTPGAWTKVDKKEGSYPAYYQTHKNFKSSVASVKLDKWWDSTAPIHKN